MNNLEHLVKNFYEKTESNGGTLCIVEQEKTGEANLIVHCSSEAVVFVIKPNNGFAYLKIKNTPDGILFIRDKQQNWELHIFECKKTVTEKSWDKVKKQFEGGILHAHMLRGLLDIPPFSRICVYTVYREEKLLEKTADPSLLRRPVGERLKSRPYEDWNDSSLRILNLDIPHEHIRLDASGQGVYAINTKQDNHP
ncbi:hypothetical protein [Parageobacillus toebii]|uniref:Uncharacterized protein n=1 Tax=Parageobacillus toebii TaxID=153151 RepID=A0A150MVT6_9BACL|nr:hypothetical protein [Parageobacillus toebii]KYD28509.1 hypothetical protein B4110_3722 [Parageobacillus toebii]